MSLRYSFYEMLKNDMKNEKRKKNQIKKVLKHNITFSWRSRDFEKTLEFENSSIMRGTDVLTKFMISTD